MANSSTTGECGAAKHHDFAEQERGTFREIDIDPPRQPRPVEQDGLLRQPGEVRACRDLQRDIELSGRSLRPIDFFRGRCRHREA